MEEIIDIIRDGREKTAIKVGAEDFAIPKHLMQGEKKKGIISDGESIQPWYWDGMMTEDDQRYIYFDRCKLETIHTIATIHRDKALMLVKRLAYALMNAGEEFLDLSSGVFPLYRIYILDGEKILLLPPDLSDVFSIMMPEEKKQRELSSLIRGNGEKGFMLIAEMAEILYYAASGILPYDNQSVQESGYRPVPLSYYEKLPEKTDGFISFVLTARSREMRDIMGNAVDGSNLRWFLQKSEELEWTLPARSGEEREKAVAEAEKNPEVQSLRARYGKKAKRNAFWRVKGTVITVLAIIAVIAGSFLYTYIRNLLEPPLTKDLEPAGIIEALYQAQSDLNPSEMDTAATADLPQDMEVINLYVSSRTRFAYENVLPSVNAAEWVENGKPAIPATSYIYGVVPETIEETGENQYLATSIWYMPFPYDESIAVPEGSLEPGTAAVYLYRVSQSFEFTWNKRGWWNISGSEITSSEFIGTESVELVPVSNELLGY